MKANSYVPYDVLEEIRVEQKWGFWRAYFSLYSQVELLPGLLQTTRCALNAIPGATMKWRVDHLMRHFIRDAAGMGYTAYRNRLDYMDEIDSHFNLQGGALKQFNTKLKNFLDPKGILSPGKSGIWPSGTSSLDRSLGYRKTFSRTPYDCTLYI